MPILLNDVTRKSSINSKNLPHLDLSPFDSPKAVTNKPVEVSFYRHKNETSLSTRATVSEV